MRDIGTGVPVMSAKEALMNWIFETYSDVYHAAMMHDVKGRPMAAAAPKGKVRAALDRLLHRA
jgi:hypothetical protein